MKASIIFIKIGQAASEIIFPYTFILYSSRKETTNMNCLQNKTVLNMEVYFSQSAHAQLYLSFRICCGLDGTYLSLEM
jgi:hypothetical protein